ncbi:hypothetical protein [Fusibacter bizertensis]
MKKKIIYVILFTTIILSSHSNISQAYNYGNNNSSDASIITPFSDIIEWRYKVDNGKLYKRLYNSTKDTWIGDWILVE